MRDQWMNRQEGFIFVYSIIDQNTFLQTQDWNEQVTRLFDRDDFPRVLFGNKCDLANERAVTTDEGQNVAKQCKIPFFEGSAKLNLNVADAFNTIIKEIWRIYPNKNPANKQANAKGAEKKRRRGCDIL
jgi:small GTP-binding protein